MNGRILSKCGNRVHRLETLLGALPADCVLDDEDCVALDERGLPACTFNLYGKKKGRAKRARSAE